MLHRCHLGIAPHHVVSGQSCSSVSHFKVLYLKSLYGSPKAYEVGAFMYKKVVFNQLLTILPDSF